MIKLKRRRGRPSKQNKRRQRTFFSILTFFILAVFFGGGIKFGFFTVADLQSFGGGVLGINSEGESFNWSVFWDEKISLFSEKWGIIDYPFNKKNEVLFSFALVADSHEDTIFFSQVIDEIVLNEVDFVLHLGDVVNAGDLSKLKDMKKILESSDLEYFVIPGDHDYNWFPQHDLSHFREVFGMELNHAFSVADNNSYFIMLNNSDRENGITQSQFEWLESHLLKAQRLEAENLFVCMHIPLYSNIFPEKVMGEGVDSISLLEQRQKLLDLFNDFEVDVIFSADVHYFSEFFEPVSRLKMVSLGASCGENCKNFLPQFVLVQVYKDGKIDITPKPYKNLNSD